MTDLKNQRKGDHYSCNLDDWVDAINLVIGELDKEEQWKLRFSFTFTNQNFWFQQWMFTYYYLLAV
jgi:hypothetical protein